ncbi:Arginase, catabolizes arginine to ornithine and urea [Gonapodya sp. JEL0774]|nr:Arginase, catabolizes arginine to ornithine and urea [Gonapodya sp. JEL0774]
MADDDDHVFPKHKFLTERAVGVIPAGFSGGQPKRGVETGPGHLIEFGLLEQLQSEELGYAVNLDDNFPPADQVRPTSDPLVGRLRNVRWVSALAKRVHDAVKSTCLKGHFALTLGGDHSLALGTIPGSASVYPDLCVVWVDAHADINTPETTISGNLHGCPVSFLLGIGSKVEQFEWLKPCLDAKRLVYIGLRDLDPGEKKIIRSLGIKAFSMHEVDKWGIGRVMEMALDHITPRRDKPIHLSFDVDALDPSVIPATGTPVRGGLTFREGHYICESLHETGLLVAMDLMEVNPLIGDQGEPVPVTVLGAGVVGLTTAVVLQAYGFSVTIVSKSNPELVDADAEYTSPKGAANWHSFADKDDFRMQKWDSVAFNMLYELGSIEGTGVKRQPSYEVGSLKPEEWTDPWFATFVPGYRHLMAHELPPNCHFGYVFNGISIDVPNYLLFLLRTFRKMGGKVQVGTVSHINELCSGQIGSLFGSKPKFVVNCSGIAARNLGGVEDKKIL